MQAGDILLFWNLPYPLASCLIAMVSGAHCDHCAVVLKDNTVYDAYPPCVRKMDQDSYQDQISEWASDRTHWRTLHNRFLRCDVWRSNDLTQDQLEAFQSEAERLIGVKYGMARNYLVKRNAIHCSEFAARLIESAGIAKFDKRLNRVTPIEIQEVLLRAGWTKVKSTEYR